MGGRGGAGRGEGGEQKLFPDGSPLSIPSHILLLTPEKLYNHFNSRLVINVASTDLDVIVRDFVSMVFIVILYGISTKLFYS